MRMTHAELVEHIGAMGGHRGITVAAISGFGGSGKSTLAEQLRGEIAGAVIVPSDDFSLGRQGVRCDDWRSIDRDRLASQVLQPARSGSAITYQLYDWPRDRLGAWREVGTPRVLVVEGIGIIHPKLVEFFDVTVWMDVSLDVASERGRFRDREQYNVDHDALWRDVWTPNDRDYLNRFRHDQMADITYAPPAGHRPPR